MNIVIKPKNKIKILSQYCDFCEKPDTEVRLYRITLYDDPESEVKVCKECKKAYRESSKSKKTDKSWPKLVGQVSDTILSVFSFLP